ncbi:MAG: DUF6894 family protein [Pseudorhizobium sp.]
MPRYYFHIRQCGLIEDPDGTQLHDIEAARAIAIEGIRDLVAESLRQGRRVEPDAVAIADEDGAILSVVTFREVLQELIPAYFQPSQDDFHGGT